MYCMLHELLGINPSGVGGGRQVDQWFCLYPGKKELWGMTVNGLGTLLGRKVEDVRN